MTITRMTSISGKPIRPMSCSLYMLLREHLGILAPKVRLVRPIYPPIWSRSDSCARNVAGSVADRRGWAAPARAQAQFVSGVHLIEVYVTVTDRDGHPVTGLTKQDFTVYENEQPQELSVFTAGEVGLSVAVALDHSFSMAGERLDMMKRATETFLECARAHRSGDADRHRQHRRGARATVDRSRRAASGRPHARRLRQHQPARCAGDRAGSDRAGARPARPRAALRRRRSLQPGQRSDVLDRARHGDVLAYPIALAKRAPPLFVDLAIATGGHSLQLTDPRRLGDTLVTIVHELRQQYLLGYAPRRASPDRPEWRGLRVTVARAGATVRARPGYWTR